MFKLMNTSPLDSARSVLKNLDSQLPDLEAFYKDLHAHPELSMQETRTAAPAADRPRAAGYEVTSAVGRTGVVGLLRADMDALPIEEATGLRYASKASATDQDGNTVPVSPMCGHDLHVTRLTGAAHRFAESRSAWQGTLMGVFQPG